MKHTALRAYGFQVTRLTRNVSEVHFQGLSVTVSDVPGFPAPVVGGAPDNVSAFAARLAAARQ